MPAHSAIDTCCLYIAFACHPNKGSEAGRGWSWLTHLAKTKRIHLITKKDPECEKEITRTLEKDHTLKKNITITTIPWSLENSPLLNYLSRDFKPLYYWHYNAWLQHTYTFCQEEIQRNPKKYQLLHYCTYSSYRNPGKFWQLPIPTIWGPIAGFTKIPTHLLPGLGLKEGSRHAIRNLLNQYHTKYNQDWKNALKGYSKILIDQTNKSLPYKNLIPISGQSIKNPKPPGAKHSPGMHIGFSGIHFSRKGGDLAILSVQRANKECQNKLTLHMVGEGPMTPQWKKLAGGDPHIHWHGGLPHQQANAIISQCHVFLFPSLLDCNPTVICEALEAGLPIITTDLPGVGDMITAQCGYRLPTTSREFLIEGAKNALIRLHTNPDHLTQLTNGALAQRSKFSFGKTMATLDNIYHTCLQPNPKRTMPDEDS